ncbi:MAG: amidohydrolase family protein [Candidatus Baldrarchaeia archaeon]
MELMIKGSFVVIRPDKILKDGVVIVEGDRIVDIGKESELKDKYSGYEAIGGKGKVVLPGLVNCHTHAAMTLLRGYADDMVLSEWLTQKIWPVEAHLKPEDVYVGTLLACLEMLKSGITTFADMYFYMDKAAKAVVESGIRAVISHGMIELGNVEKGEKDLKEAERIVKTCQGLGDGRVTTMFGPHAPYTCSPEYLQKVKETAEKYNVGIHIHLAETRDEAEKIKNAFAVDLKERGVIEYVDELGILDPTVLAAHVVWVSEKEIEILAKRGVKVAHNPVSNLKLASGVAPIPQMLKNGVAVGLATDGAASNNCLDIFEEMKVSAIIHKAHNFDPTVTSAAEVLEMATIGGAKALLLDKDIGTLEVGKKADIVILDLKNPRLVPLHNIISHLVYAAKSSDVCTVIVDGNILMENREVKILDENKVMELAQKTAEDLISRAQT